MVRRLVLIAALLALAAPGNASAAGKAAPGGAATLAPPMVLPGDAHAAASRADWIVGATPGAAADAVARDRTAAQDG